MARKKSKKGKHPSQYVNIESTLKKLQTQLTDPRMYRWIFAGATGVRERLMKMNYDVLRNVVDKVPIVNAIINARCDQIMRYCVFSKDEGDKGFIFELVDPAEGEGELNDKEIFELKNFLDQTGFNYNDEREDDLVDYCQMLTREMFTIDQIATEVQYNRMGEVAAFWLLDGASIKRVTEENDFKRGIRFVQEIEQKIYNEYTSEQVIFDYKYKRADIRYRGYGYSPVEQCIDIITTLLFGYNYIRDQLIRDRVPKGFLSVMGDVGKTEMDAIRNYWYAAMTGAGASWNIPILPSGKDGVGIDFKTLNQSNRDMEYHKLMMFVSSIAGAVFGIDLAEIGIKTDDHTSLIGENPAPKLEQSRNRGMGSLLGFIEQHINKLLRKVQTKYKLKFVGMEPTDKEQQATIRAKLIATNKTINEIREEDGDKPIDEEYANMVLNPQSIQVYLAEKQAEQQKEMQEQGMGGEEYNGEQYGGNGNGQGQENKTPEIPGGEEVRKALMKSLTKNKERVVRYIIE